MPKDPAMLLSFINTQLRDHYESLDDLAAAYDTDAAQICERLRGIGYSYDTETNRFIAAHTT